MNTQIAGKTCIVTGATNGIGEVTAQALANMGATVVGVGRSQAKCNETANRIKAATGNPAIEFLASSPEVERVSGRYFEDKRVVTSSPISQDAAAAKRL